MLDDQALIVNLKDKGLVIFTGCAHSGIVNTINHAKQITKIEKIYAIVGGFHLLNADEQRIQKTIKELEKGKQQLKDVLEQLEDTTESNEPN